MKKHLLFSAFILSSSLAFSQLGYLPNSSFENWSTNTIFSNPDTWGTSNFREAQIANATQSSDAQHLSSSIKLENMIVNNGADTAFAYCYLGYVGDEGPSAGIPYATQVDQINGYYKGSIGSGDTAFVMVIKFNAGNMVSFDFLPITASQSTWTPFTFSINSAAQDSIFLGMLSSNPFVYPQHAHPATSLLFDNISLSHSINGAGPALPNYSFETWTPVDVTEPDNWATLNPIFVSMGFENVIQSNDANSGSSAAQISTITNTFGDTLRGLLVYGEIYSGFQPMPVPYTATPTTFTGAYKYTMGGADNPFIGISLYSGGTVIGGNSVMITPTTTYTTFSIGTNLIGTPDSAIVICFSGNNPGSVLLVDDLQFSGGDVSVNENISNVRINTYPNPAQDKLTVESDLNEMVTITIFDIQGKIVYTQTQMSLVKSEIDVSEFKNGLYNMQIESGESTIVRSISVLH